MTRKPPYVLYFYSVNQLVFNFNLHKRLKSSIINSKNNRTKSADLDLLLKDFNKKQHRTYDKNNNSYTYSWLPAFFIYISTKCSCTIQFLRDKGSNYPAPLPPTV